MCTFSTPWKPPSSAQCSTATTTASSASTANSPTPPNPPWIRNPTTAAAGAPGNIMHPRIQWVEKPEEQGRDHLHLAIHHKTRWSHKYKSKVKVQLVVIVMMVKQQQQRIQLVSSACGLFNLLAPANLYKMLSHFMIK